MNIVRIKISDWRSISGRELLLEPGLNILRGENEAGKSTIVEAIQKALYWDHTARKQKNDNIDFIVPANNPNARPTVELELRIGQTRVIINKTVSGKKDHRQCTLKVLDPQAGERTFRNAQAEEKLRDLLARSHAMPGLDWSDQSEGYAYLAESLPIAACGGASIGKDGTIMPSARLEQLRKRIGTRATSSSTSSSSSRWWTVPARARSPTNCDRRDSKSATSWRPCEASLQKWTSCGEAFSSSTAKPPGWVRNWSKPRSCDRTRQALQKRQKEAEGARQNALNWPRLAGAIWRRLKNAWKTSTTCASSATTWHRAATSSTIN